MASEIEDKSNTSRMEPSVFDMIDKESGDSKVTTDTGKQS